MQGSTPQPLFRGKKQKRTEPKLIQGMVALTSLEYGLSVPVESIVVAT